MRKKEKNTRKREEKTERVEVMEEYSVRRGERQKEGDPANFHKAIRNSLSVYLAVLHY